MNSQTPPPKRRSTRWTWILVSLGAILLLLICTVAAQYVAYFSPSFYRTAASSPIAVPWPSFPTPVSIRSDWQTFANSNQVNDVLRFNGWVWIATDGGLVVYNPADGAQVQFTVDHGLPANRVTTVAVGPDDAIWVGTVTNGVGRYDGSAWVQFDTEDGLPHNQVNALVTDPAGVIWAATPNGIGRYDGVEWRLVRFSLLDLSVPDVRDLETTTHQVWAATADGVWAFDGSDWVRYGLEDGLINEDVTSIAIAPDGRVWVATPSGLGVYDRGRWDRVTVRDGLIDAPIEQVVARPDNQVWIRYAAEAGPALHLFDGIVPTLTPIPNQETPLSMSVIGNSLWVGTNERLFQTSSSDWSTLPLPNAVPKSVTGITERDGALWLAGEGQLTRLVDGKWETVRSGTFSSMMTDPITGDLVLTQDRPSDGVTRFNGVEWSQEPCRTAGPDLNNMVDGAIGPDGSVWIFGAARAAGYLDQTWQHIEYVWSDEVQVRSGAVAADGTLWIGTNSGLYQYDPASALWTLTAPDNFYWLTTNSAGDVWYISDVGVGHVVDGRPEILSFPPVQQPTRGFLATEDGVWVSSWEGVAQLQLDGSWRLHTMEDGLAAVEIVTLGLDPSGRVYAGYNTDRLGVSYFDEESDRWRSIYNIIDPDEPNNGHIVVNPRRDEVIALGITENQDVWLGTYFGEMSFIGPDRLLETPNDPYLHWDSVRDMVTDESGGIWVMGWSGNLARFDPQTETWERYDRRLSQSQVQSLVTDEDGRAWLGTDMGVVEVGENGVCEFVPNRTDFNVIDGFLEPQSGSIWWLTTKSGVQALDQTSFRLAPPMGSLSAARMTSAALGRDQSIWFTERDQVSRLTSSGLLEPTIDEDDRPAASIQALVIDDRLEPWIGTPIGAFTLEGGAWRQFGPAEGLADRNVTDIWAASDGSIWFVTDGGVSVYRP